VESSKLTQVLLLSEELSKIMKEDVLTILLIEDHIAEARLLQEFLKSTQPQQFNLVHVQRLKEALDRLKDPSPYFYDVILLDLTLPDSRGLTAIAPLSMVAPKVPIIVLTNTNNEELAVAAVRHGAQDYLVKRQLNREILVRSLRYAIGRKQVAEELHHAKAELEIRVQERTAELAQAKELAQVTLHSIGDAVIVTDATGRIESLNPAAENLTGWKLAAAKGQFLSEVFHLCEETTCTSIQDPIAEVLANQCLMQRSNHILSRPRDGKEFIVEYSAAPIHLENAEMRGVVLVCRDVTRTHTLANELAWQASHDALTGFLNRTAFECRLKEVAIEAQNSATQHVLCYLDLDQLKIVNDTCGHLAGDELLCQIASLLQKMVRKTDILARLGGDEFGILLHQCSSQEGCIVANKLLENIQQFRFVWQDKIFNLGVSIGLVAIDANTESSTRVLSIADTAMYAAKEKGGNRVHIYEPDDQDLVKRHGEMAWVSKIVRALEEDRFCLYYQAIAPVRSATSETHYELLIRMKDEEGKLLPPIAFIPAAERYNLMPKIDRWVIATFFKHYRCIVNNLSATTSIFSINLCGASFSDERFFDFLQEQFDWHQISPKKICFEITETLAITNLSKAINFITQLKEIGCQFALDDFGTGMSSLAYLKNLPVDYLKIDGHFIKNIVEDPINSAMVEGINRIGHIMGLQTIAEFVENDAILEKLKSLEIDYAQGYGIGKPQPLPINEVLSVKR
jgi:diguanylate cyclase (GGDEF)-like protein/PAS domain S-box-containing protein